MISSSNLSICFYHTEYMVLQTAAHRLLSSIGFQPSELTALVAKIVQWFSDSTIRYICSRLTIAWEYPILSQWTLWLATNISNYHMVSMWSVYWYTISIENHHHSSHSRWTPHSRLHSHLPPLHHYLKIPPLLPHCHHLKCSIFFPDNTVLLH